MPASDNLPPNGQVLPGFFGRVNYGAPSGGSGANDRLLLVGLIGSTAQRPPNLPFLPSSQQEVDDGCERGSELASMYAAALSQPEAQGAEVWCLPITPNSGGVASTYKLKPYVSNTNPSKAGSIQLWLGSQPVATVGFDATSTSTTIGADLLAALNAMPDFPLGTCSQVGDVVTVPFRHKGANGEDLPIRCEITPAGTGVTLSPGQALFATAATGAGTVRVTVGSVTVSTAIANTDTAAQIATKVAASWNASGYPLTAVVDGSVAAQVNFLFANKRDVRRMTATVVTSTGTTVDLGSGATSGVGSSSSLTYNGAQGTGAPSLTQAITNMLSDKAYRTWVCPWLDTATLGTIATHLEAMSDGSISGQKPQDLMLCDWEGYSTAGAIPPAVSPNLQTADPHYALGWSLDVPVRAVEIAARVGAARSALWISQPNKNWNGFQIRGNQRSPILLPATTPDKLSQNAALRTYGLAPICVGPSGNLEIVKGRTTSMSSDKRLWSWSAEAQAAYHLVDLQEFLPSRFQGGSIVKHGPPRAAGLFDTNSVKSAFRERMAFWERQGNYDGADALKDGVEVTINSINPARFDAKYPESPVVDLDQIVFVGTFTGPTQ